MTLRLIRERSVQATTLGVLFVDDRFFAWSLEDRIREIVGQPVAQWKVAGETAIPAGTYPVRISFSPRFKRALPEVLNVEGFSGIRFHPLNRHSETEGCIGVGDRRLDKEMEIRESRPACDRLQDAIEGSLNRGESVWLRIENPLSH